MRETGHLADDETTISSNVRRGFRRGFLVGDPSSLAEEGGMRVQGNGRRSPRKEETHGASLSV